MTYQPQALIEWILYNSREAVRVGKTAELKFPCPKCGHPSHYFNVKKGIGHCHRAKCLSNTEIEELINLWGSSPEQLVVTAYEEEVKQKDTSVLLPSNTIPIITNKDYELVTQVPEVVEHLGRDRFVNTNSILKWSLRFDVDNERIVIPVIEGGKLRNYVSRAVWWYKGRTDFKRYDYPKGHTIKDWIFGWEESKRWKELVIVENTFNAIWLRQEGLPCTTFFGSYVSEVQLQQIHRSAARKITFLWDYGAENAAQKACIKICKYGIPSTFVNLSVDKQQPDDYTIDEIKAML